MESKIQHPPTTQPLSPRLVGVAMFLFFPLGFYLLWRHPTLGKNGKWWAAGIAWGVAVMFMASREENSPKTTAEAEIRAVETTGSRTSAPVASMRRIAEATLPTVYGDIKEYKWSQKFLAGKEPSPYGWGGTVELADGTDVFVSFFPKGSDFLWLSSPSDGGMYAAGYSDTKYWDSKGNLIKDGKVFWKRAGYSYDKVLKESKEMAQLNRSNDDQKRKRNEERFMRNMKDASNGR